jgi:hypothetical protein
VKIDVHPTHDGFAIVVLSFWVISSGSLILKKVFGITCLIKSFHKYKNRLDAIFPWLPLQTINVNMSFDHVSNNFHNSLISIT